FADRFHQLDVEALEFGLGRAEFLEWGIGDVGPDGELFASAAATPAAGGFAAAAASGGDQRRCGNRQRECQYGKPGPAHLGFPPFGDSVTRGEKYPFPRRLAPPIRGYTF